MTLEADLQKRAQVWAGQITKKAHANLGNKRRLVVVRSRVENRRSRIGIISTAHPTAVSEYGDVKDVARAYEFGSGIHSTGRYGAKRKYIIAPRRKKVLAFYWDKVNAEAPRGPKFRGVSGETGKALFKFVEHPGVRAANGGKGYLRPAITEVRKKLMDDFKKMGAVAYLGTTRKAFKNAK